MHIVDSWLYLILSAIVQGITEFIPVSSSAHLLMLDRLMNSEPQRGIYLAVVLHAGTLLAVILFLRQEILLMIKHLPKFLHSLIGGTGSKSSLGVKMWFNALYATIPVVIIGALVHKLNLPWLRSNQVMAVNSLIFAGLLYFSDKQGSVRKTIRDLNTRDSFLIGCAQALAVIPGVSRLGACLSAALLLGYRRQDSLVWSFLLSIPAIVGAVVLESYAILQEPAILQKLAIEWYYYFISMLIAGLVGLLTMGFITSWATNNRFTIFIFYRILFSLCLFAIS